MKKKAKAGYVKIALTSFKVRLAGKIQKNRFYET